MFHNRPQSSPSGWLYYFRRLAPFFLVSLGYEAIEAGILGLSGSLDMDCWSVAASLANLLAQNLASCLFLLIPYLLYLLALPAPFHGGKTDRFLTAAFFLLFCLIHASEEAAEIASDDRFSLYSMQFLQHPGDLWNSFMADAPIAWILAGIAVAVAAAFLLFRPWFRRQLPPVPDAFVRLAAPVFALALAFALSLGSSGMQNTCSESGLSEEGMFVFFGDLFAFTPLPDLPTIFRAPTLAAAVAMLAVLALRPVARRLCPEGAGLLLSSIWKRIPLLRRYAVPSRFGFFLFLLLAAILLLRLVSMGAYPLMDTTEARYGEMARKMLETANWLTPQFDYGVPFWGKPPLSFWASAGTMKIAGIGAWGARLAPFLATFTAGLLFFAWPFDGDGRQRRLMALSCWIVTAISGIGFVASGAVMTDSFLALGLMLSMVSFYRALDTPQTRSIWKYLFFVGLAVGLLGKGPLALVLTGLPLLLWVALTRRWRDMWKCLPWLKGTALALALSVPWYVLAERATPGFLNYFIAGEHFHRFIDKGWQGDLYGSGHARTIGTVWLYGIVMFLPWSLLLPFLLYKVGLRSRSRAEGKSPGAIAYLVCWAISPLLFFTFARNILPAYVLPSIPPLAILTVEWIRRAAQRYPGAHDLVLMPVALVAVMAFFLLGGGFQHLEYRCQRDLLRYWDGESPLFYVDEKRVPYSAQFYSQGRARRGDPSIAPGEGKIYAAVRQEDYRLRPGRWQGWKAAGASRGWMLLISPGAEESKM